MTINTDTIRDAAEVLDTLTSTLAVDHPLRTQAAARAKSCVSGLYSAADTIDAQTAEIARLREALKPLAEVDLTEPPPNDFAWFVLRARAVLSGESNAQG